MIDPRGIVLSLALASLLSLTGCPDPSSKSGKSGSEKTDEAGKTDAPAAPEDPLEGSLFNKEELFAIYVAYQSPKDPASGELLRKQRLVDAAGERVEARHEAYERALSRYAKRDPKGWSAFVATLPR